MAGTRFQDIAHNSNQILDLTTLTKEEFYILLPFFEEEFQNYVSQWRLDGKPRTKRGYATYKNCPLLSAEDRLFFILAYLKSNALQVFHGQLFGMPQCKANVWIHLLLPILQKALKNRGDIPSRNLEELEQLLTTSVKKKEESNPLFLTTE